MDSVKRLMLDICAGMMGASRAARERGWNVVTLDNDPKFGTDIIADVREWSWTGERPDLLWMSPPCTEFAREWMPWCRIGMPPDLSIYRACLRLVDEIRPRYWIVENVRGAVPYFGKPAAIYGPFHLWGYFPPLGGVRLNMRKKESYSSSRPELRAEIPYALSRAVIRAIELQPELMPL